MTLIATNRKARHKFTLLDKWECGIALNGGEVKSVRAGQVSFKDTFARVDGGEVYLYNLHISPYEQVGYITEEPDRKRKLLLHKQEIKRIIGLVSAKMLTLVPTRIYLNGRGWVKVEIALAQGKKIHDKRQSIKEKTVQREMSRALRSRQR